MNSRIFESDFLVIGSGIAGLTFAIKAAEIGSVHIVTKKKETDSNTNYAQGGIASVLSPTDNLESHIEDTMRAGAWLGNRKAVEVLVHNGPQRIHDLIEWGTRFSSHTDNNGTPVLDLGREGGHTHNRIVHALDLTGQEVERALVTRIRQLSNVTIFEDHTAVDLLTEHQLGENTEGETRCYGAYILENETGDIHTFKARATLLASGGAGHVYLHTTNPDIATGDGIATAYRAGAVVSDMEFMQFHPTSFYKKKHDHRALLISEAVRGEGAILRNSRGERFMEDLHPMKELAPRDIVARAIDRELKRLGDPCVYLDISFKGEEFLKERFPFIYASCLKEGIDIARDPIPVVPAAHYLCGGVVTDLEARTSIRNLYAAGETACTGVHGANRLASNSLLEALVFAGRAFDHACNLTDIKDHTPLPDFPSWNKEGTFDHEEWILIQHNIIEIKQLMWDYVGIVRTDLRLKRALSRIIFLEQEIIDYYRRSTVTPGMIELRNLATIARMIITGALARQESRGLHYNLDHPDPSDEMHCNFIQRNGQNVHKDLLANISFTW